jgi:hypothetical protein
VKPKVHVAKRGAIDTSKLRVLRIRRQVLVSARHESLKLDGISISESQLESCVFKDIQARSVSLGSGRGQSVYTNCTFERCTFEISSAGNTRLIGCEFRDCVLRGIVGNALEAVGCSFLGGRIERAVFYGALPPSRAGLSRRSNEFRDNDFSSTTLLDTSFRGGINLNAQRLPTGRGYLLVNDIHKALVSGEKLILSLPDSDKRSLKRQLFFLTLAEKWGQESVLLQTGELGALEDEWRSLIASV